MPGEPGRQFSLPLGWGGGTASGAPPQSGNGGGGRVSVTLGRGGAEEEPPAVIGCLAPTNGRPALRPSNKPDLALPLAARQPRPALAEGGMCAARSAPWRPAGLRALRPPVPAEPWDELRDKREIAGRRLLGTLPLAEVAPRASVSVGGGEGARRRWVVVDLIVLCLRSS